MTLFAIQIIIITSGFSIYLLKDKLERLEDTQIRERGISEEYMRMIAEVRSTVKMIDTTQTMFQQMLIKVSDLADENKDNIHELFRVVDQRKVIYNITNQGENNENNKINQKR